VEGRLFVLSASPTSPQSGVAPGVADVRPLSHLLTGRPITWQPSLTGLQVPAGADADERPGTDSLLLRTEWAATLIRFSMRRRCGCCC
jgi:hypothetical protein